MTATDIETIAPVGALVSIDGIEARVKHVRFREVLLLVRILSSGIGPGIADLTLDPDDPEEMKAELIGMMLVALPNAIEESLTFFKTVVEPTNPDQQKLLRAAMDNPETGDVLDVVQILIEQEQDNLFEIWGKVQTTYQTLQKVAEKKKPAGIDVRSPAPSTSSPASTDGQTS